MNPYRREEDTVHLTAGVRLAGLEDQKLSLPSSSLVSWPIANTFRREGELWTVSFDHRVAQVQERKGFVDIAQLLSRPFEEIHCMVLCGQPGVASRGDAIFDEQARQAYRQRIREIDQELAEAERDNDPGRYTPIEEEKEHLLDEIRKATGLGGRQRKLADAAERTRSAVTWRIRDAIRKLEPVHSTLARHLANSIQTGLFCSYHPEKPTTWFV